MPARPRAASLTPSGCTPSLLWPLVYSSTICSSLTRMSLRERFLLTPTCVCAPGRPSPGALTKACSRCTSTCTPCSEHCQQQQQLQQHQHIHPSAVSIMMCNRDVEQQQQQQQVTAGWLGGLGQVQQ